MNGYLESHIPREQSRVPGIYILSFFFCSELSYLRNVYETFHRTTNNK